MNNVVLPYLKAYAALLGSVATALLAVYAQDTEVGHWLTVIAVIATTIVTWAIPNKDPKGTHQEESVQPADTPDRGVVGLDDDYYNPTL